jgi:hypothetical protein
LVVDGRVMEIVNTEQALKLINFVTSTGYVLSAYFDILSDFLQLYDIGLVCFIRNFLVVVLILYFVHLTGWPNSAGHSKLWLSFKFELLRK